MNEQMDAKETAKVMAEFTKQNEYMNVKEDMLDDALMDAVREGGWEGGEERTACMLGEFFAFVRFHPPPPFQHSQTWGREGMAGPGRALLYGV